ncbi:hypothetical protein [Consotaella aegiceratis]|uniref:hypothetical protein n=1 Tax=Consotaella aegiceratis TaxID=3097961 RepID=UPI002F42582B
MAIGGVGPGLNTFQMLAALKEGKAVDIMRDGRAIARARPDQETLKARKARGASIVEIDPLDEEPAVEAPKPVTRREPRPGRGFGRLRFDALFYADFPMLDHGLPTKLDEREAEYAYRAALKDMGKL